MRGLRRVPGRWAVLLAGIDPGRGGEPATQAALWQIRKTSARCRRCGRYQRSRNGTADLGERGADLLHLFRGRLLAFEDGEVLGLEIGAADAADIGADDHVGLAELVLRDRR